MRSLLMSRIKILLYYISNTTITHHKIYNILIYNHLLQFSTNYLTTSLTVSKCLKKNKGKKIDE